MEGPGKVLKIPRKKTSACSLPRKVGDPPHEAGPKFRTAKRRGRPIAQGETAGCRNFGPNLTPVDVSKGPRGPVNAEKAEPRAKGGGTVRCAHVIFVGKKLKKPGHNFPVVCSALGTEGGPGPFGNRLGRRLHF